MARQIGPRSAEPLAVMLEWRVKELDARLRVIESRIAVGAELTIGRPAEGNAGHPAARVWVGIGNCQGCNGSNLVGLTVDEAREMAAALLAEAATVAGQA